LLLTHAPDTFRLTFSNHSLSSSPLFSFAALKRVRNPALSSSTPATAASIAAASPASASAKKRWRSTFHSA
jgi:hypothetical protein